MPWYMVTIGHWFSVGWLSAIIRFLPKWLARWRRRCLGLYGDISQIAPVWEWGVPFRGKNPSQFHAETASVRSFGINGRHGLTQHQRVSWLYWPPRRKARQPHPDYARWFCIATKPKTTNDIAQTYKVVIVDSPSSSLTLYSYMCARQSAAISWTWLLYSCTQTTPNVLLVCDFGRLTHYPQASCQLIGGSLWST